MVFQYLRGQLATTGTRQKNVVCSGLLLTDPLSTRTPGYSSTVRARLLLVRVQYRYVLQAPSCQELRKKKIEIRSLFANSRVYLDLDSIEDRLHFGVIFRNYTRTLVRQ